MPTAHEHGPGIILPCGSRIVPISAATHKRPFQDIPVTLSELSPGVARYTAAPAATGAITQHGEQQPNPQQYPGFSGQLGLIHFSTHIRLPRHVHIAESPESGSQYLVSERIIVLNGTAIVEICGQLYVVPPETMVHIAAGAPHTWTACPAGVPIATHGREESGVESVSTGSFLMVYEYEDVTAFYPTAQTEVLKTVECYERSEEEEWPETMIPVMDAEEVVRRCRFV